MITLEELRRRKKEMHLTNQEIADLSGLPLGTVQKVLAGITRSPRCDTLQALEKVLGQNQKQPKYQSGSQMQTSMVCEAGATYAGKAEAKSEKNESVSHEGWYTYQDYIALPEERRVELIDGRFYDMASPNSSHQIIIGQLHLQFSACVQEHPGCMVLLSPMDVMLDEDEYTVVQPDLMVFCDLKRLRKGRVFGAPDLVVEIVSPGSGRRDYTLKVAKYLAAGVREYWIVDHKKGKVLVYFCDPQNSSEETAPEIALYGMEDKIPVRISEGKCSIDMAPITKLLESLGDIG